MQFAFTEREKSAARKGQDCDGRRSVRSYCFTGLWNQVDFKNFFLYEEKIVPCGWVREKKLSKLV